MNHAQPVRVSVVEIPLLLDSIVQDLSHHDIWNCAQVCSLWREIFEPHQWRHVSLTNKDGTPFFQSLLEVERAQIVQHAGMIRGLKVNFGDKHLDQFKCPKLETLIFALGWDEWRITDWSSFGFEPNGDADSDDVDIGDDSSDDEIDDEDGTALAVGEADADMMSPGVDESTLDVATVENMTNLDIELSDDLTWWGEEDEGGEGNNNNLVVANLEGGVGTVNVVVTPDQTRTKSRRLGGAWSLLDNTPGLLTLHLPLGQYTPDLRSRLFRYFDNISSSIRTNEIRYLAHLTLEFCNNAGVDMLSVLRHLPESLLSVEFRIYASHYNNNRFAEATLSFRNSKELYPLRPLSLTRISLYVNKLDDFGCREDLLWFLRRCPQLRDLSLPSLSSKSGCESLFHTVVRSCSKLERLCLNMKVEWQSPLRTSQAYFGRNVETTFESQAFSMLAPLALKRLSIDIGNDDENVTLQTLEQWSKDSLEELQLVRSGPMEAIEFEKIRSTYPKLNRITYWKGHQNLAPEVNED